MSDGLQIYENFPNYNAKLPLLVHEKSAFVCILCSERRQTGVLHVLPFTLKTCEK